MAHSKVYGICENKCKVETLSKDQLTSGAVQVGDSAKLGGKSADSYYNLGVPTQTIPSGADLNDYIEVGQYQSNTLADNVSNTPLNNQAWFTLRVEKDAVVVTQYYQSISTNIEQYVRKYYDGTWTEWINVSNQVAWNLIGSVTGANSVAIDTSKYSEFLVLQKAQSGLVFIYTIPSGAYGLYANGCNANSDGFSVHCRINYNTQGYIRNDVMYENNYDSLASSTMTVYGR